MEYTVGYIEGVATSLRYEPIFVDSSGYHSVALGEIAIERFVPKCWKLELDGSISRHVLPDDDYQKLTETVQAEVTNMMDVLAEFKTLSDIFAEYNQNG